MPHISIRIVSIVSIVSKFSRVIKVSIVSKVSIVNIVYHVLLFRWFKTIDWDEVYCRQLKPPIVPKV